MYKIKIIISSVLSSYSQKTTVCCNLLKMLKSVHHIFIQFGHILNPYLSSAFVVVVVVDPTPPTCCQQSPAPESCGSQQSLTPGGKERLHFVGIRPEVQARKGGW